MNTASIKPAAALSEEEKYSVGTLRYTKMGLLAVAFWILWGDFCFTIMENLFPVLLPIQLKRMGGGVEDYLGIMRSTLPMILNFTVCPIVSFKSDRYRSKWGRRIPFMVLTAPFLAISLILLGYSEQIAKYVKDAQWGQALHLSPSTVVIIVVCLIVISFNFFNVFVNSIYWYLFADVIPQAYLSRFMAFFRIMSALSTAFFYKYIFGVSKIYMTEIYVGVAVLYLVGFGLMCWKVKEGEYPPVEELGEPKQNWITSSMASVKIYFKECFTHPIFLCLFIANAAVQFSSVTVAYRYYFHASLGISEQQMGDVLSILSIIVCVIYIPLGYLSDRIHPIRAQLIALFFLIPTSFLGIFIKDFTSFWIIFSIIMPFNALFDLTAGPMLMSLLPKSKYGQFASANAMVKSLFGGILGGIFVSKFFAYMTIVGHASNGDPIRIDANYKYTYVLFSISQLIAFLCLLAVYFYWRKRGGINYVPPEEFSLNSVPS